MTKIMATFAVDGISTPSPNKEISNNHNPLPNGYQTVSVPGNVSAWSRHHGILPPTSDYVKVEQFEGRDMLVVDPEALTVLARQATHDNAFMLRREHNEMVAKILHDPEASDNDKFVALTMLRNAEVAAKGQLPSARTPAQLSS